MNTQRLTSRLWLIGLGVLLAACSPSGVSESGSSVQGLSASLDCPAGSLNVSDRDLAVIGKSGVQVGDAVTYSLPDAAGCVASKVEWVTANSKASLQDSSLVTQFEQPGQYVVGAQLTTDSGQVQWLGAAMTVVVADEMKISAPQIGFEMVETQFQVIVPQGMSIQNVAWSFGDSSTGSGLSTTKVYNAQGSLLVTAVVTEAGGRSVTLQHPIQILPLADELFCAQDLAISAPSEVSAGDPANYAVVIPSCLNNYNPQVSWRMGDGTRLAGNSVDHTYAASGERVIQVSIRLSHPIVTTLNLTHTVTVISSEVDLNRCSQVGEERERFSENSEEIVACGKNGQRKDTYRNRIIEKCDLVGEYLDWTLVSSTRELVSQGTCENQSCQLTLASGEVRELQNGESLTLFSEKTPAGSCAENSQVRTCNNGVISGTDFFKELTCNSGCGDFGRHGTTVTGIVIGQTQVQKQCQFGEQGIFDTYTQIADRVCDNGSVIESNVRQGSLSLAGSCPVYDWVATDNYTACTADCGGKQQRIFECRNDKNEMVDEVRCSAQQPEETRLCDANPEAVRRTEVKVTEEDGGQSATCPANQIGVILRYREVTKTIQYACVNHLVGVESEDVAYGPWVEEKYCRDFVARRCSHDSLSIQQAQGRYDWMVKCQDQVPVIKEFLAEFEDVKVANKDKNGSKSTWTLNGKGRKLYPTFMNRATTPEKVWKAPVTKTASCEVPETVYIAAVCVASCATPEQEIIAQAKANQKLSKVSFIDALTQNYGFVGTLASNSSMAVKQIKKTKVDQWVTELVDSEHQILNFKMKSGGTLRITPNHPLVSAEGAMKIADEFKVGDSLVKLGGQLDEITDIVPEVYFGKVYNVFVKSNALHHNIVVTNGYLNGTAFFQNEGAKNLNKALFRKKIIRGAFPQR
ncbi:MAG: cell surface protein [Pseudobdellovibrionaceae bacterium]